MAQRPNGGSESTRALADALWDGIRHYAPIASSSGGLRGWYLSGPYAGIVARRRARAWQHRSPEPWLTLQWALDRAAGGAVTRTSLRYDGFPGQHSYEDSYRAVADGQFSPPYVYVAGYSRSGTTSLQNLVLAAFPDHVQPGRWDGPGHPLRLWWYPKHNDDIARRIAALDPAVARVVLCVRPFVDSATSLALYTGLHDPAEITSEWISSSAVEWQRLAELATEPRVVSVPFSWLSSVTPAECAAFLSGELGIAAAPGVDETATWDDIYAGRISPEELDNPYLSNLPHDDRPALAGPVRERIVDLVGRQAERLEETYLAAVDA